MMQQSLETDFYSKGRNDPFKNNVTYLNNSEEEKALQIHFELEQQNFFK